METKKDLNTVTCHNILYTIYIFLGSQNFFTEYLVEKGQDPGFEGYEIPNWLNHFMNFTPTFVQKMVENTAKVHLSVLGQG